MHLRYLFSVVLFLSLALTAAWTSHNASRPVALTEAPVDRLACASYAPYRLPGESPFDPDHSVSEARIETDLRKLLAVTDCVRTYSTQQGIGLVPKVAQRLNMTVLLGIWIGRDPVANDTEVDAGITLAREFGNTITGVIVGNEVLLRREQTAEGLAAYIDKVRESVDVPVTYADVWEFWFKNDALASHVDYVTAHILPFWEDEPVGIEEAVAHVVDVFGTVEERFAGKRVMIGETGWPSAGRMRGPARPGLVEQARFVREWVVAANAGNIDYNLIEAFDQPWKRRLEGAMGGHWGLLDSDGAIKFPWRGPVTETPRAFMDSLVGAGLFALIFVTVNRILERLRPTRSDSRASPWQTITLAAAVGLAAGALFMAQLRYLIDWNRFAAEWMGSATFWASGLLLAVLFATVTDGAGRLPALRQAGRQLLGKTAASGDRLMGLAGVLRAVLLFGLATFLVLHAFDARYRGFAIEVHALTSAILLGLWLQGHGFDDDAVEERWLGLVALVCIPFMVWHELPHNHQAIALAAIALPGALYPLWARQRAAPGLSSNRLASNTATAPGSTE